MNFYFLLDAIIDSLKLLPFLLIAYIAIEVIEYVSTRHLEHTRLLTSKWSTLFGAGFGLVPQCGFSVVATDLFSKHKISIGTLLAVYISTSDEAIPLLIMNPSKALSLLPLLLIKFVLAIAVGYFVNLIFKKQNQKHLSIACNTSNATQTTQAEAEHNHEHEHEHENIVHQDLIVEEHHTGCCGHDIEESSKNAKVKRFLLHPLVHSLKIFAFILIVNIIFGLIIELVGTEKLMAFLSSSRAFSPILACIIGLIPNCASSVVITELYAMGGIGFGAMVAGLIVNAGIAFVVLFKQNKNIKQNFAILGSMFVIGLVTGYIIQLIGF